jgi:hypothetical protein
MDDDTKREAWTVHAACRDYYLMRGDPLHRAALRLAAALADDDAATLRHALHEARPHLAACVIFTDDQAGCACATIDRLTMRADRG